MIAAEHYAEAERLVAQARDGEHCANTEDQLVLIAAAQVHATLAQIGDAR